MLASLAALGCSGESNAQLPAQGPRKGLKGQDNVLPRHRKPRRAVDLTGDWVSVVTGD